VIERKKEREREEEEERRNLVMGRLGLTSTPVTLAKFPISPKALRFFPSAFFCCFPPPTTSPRKSQPNYPFRQISSHLNTQIYKITPTTTRRKYTLENFMN